MRSSACISTLARVRTSFPEEGSGLGVLHAVANPFCQDAVEGTGHKRQLQIHINFHGYGCAEGIHVEEVDGIRQRRVFSMSIRRA